MSEYIAIPAELFGQLEEYFADRQDASMDDGQLVPNREMVILRDLRFDAKRVLVADLLAACERALVAIELLDTVHNGSPGKYRPIKEQLREAIKSARGA